MADVQARIKLIEGIQLLGESGSGHTVVMDAHQDLGGRDMGIRPMELILMGLGGCASIDVLSILRKGRHEVQDCVATLQATRAPTDPKVFTAITIHFIVTGKSIPEKAVARAIQLSEETYCSASAMLGKTASIHTTFEIRES
ncbi:MAG: OsmC family protein [Magnetococcales bacterium]|nr:OsmC family protein [Magnetococcales bacterium]MBF0149784.1 OsmC family protein [Magnetococcales bacterium]MBF0173088.1 OsmC family protein [Magnetococcales bacterium]MBF0347228.1 OsmC family protein [Magnetococcales bacterium]MBF0630169.1 OsmC family protein [Magnetococcales bacterium]